MHSRPTLQEQHYGAYLSFLINSYHCGYCKEVTLLLCQQCTSAESLRRAKSVNPDTGKEGQSFQVALRSKAHVHQSDKCVCPCHPGSDSGPEESMQQQELVAACNVLSAILSVEHRAVQPHLADIWRLLWLAARGNIQLIVMYASSE